MRISAIFEIPSALDQDVPERMILEYKELFEKLPTIEKIRYLMEALFCFNKAIVEKNKEKISKFFAMSIALRDLLAVNPETVILLTNFEQFTRTYLVTFIYGTYDKPLPEEVRKLLKEQPPTIQFVTVPIKDFRAFAILLGSLLTMFKKD